MEDFLGKEEKLSEGVVSSLLNFPCSYKGKN